MRWSAVLVAVVGCYAPTPPTGAPCDAICPSGQVCAAGSCRLRGEELPDAALDDAPVAIDAIDAPPGDAPIVDSDGDGLFDGEDNCVAIANPDQHDEDADARGDACDPCPHLAGTGADGDLDGVGDACDPQPAIAKQQWVYFDPFTSRRAEWAASAAATFANDRMTLVPPAYIRLNVPNGESRIAIAGQLAAFTGPTHQTMLQLGTHADGRHWYAEAYGDADGGSLNLTRFDGTDYTPVVSTPYPAPPATFAFQLDSSVAAQRLTLASRLGTQVYPVIQTPTTGPPLVTSAYYRFGTVGVTTSYDYVAIIATLP